MLLDTVQITTTVRRVRGGSQARLVEGDDRHMYIAKFQGNPQGTRTLVNEWVAHWFLRNLSITTPQVRLLRLSQTVIEKANLHFQAGSRTLPVRAGLHFGSQCPANPNRTAIFDFLPRICLHLVTNLDDFGKALVLDTLLGHTDSRQAIFVREGAFGGHKPRFRGYLIDYGLIFGGRRWTLEDRAPSRPGMHNGVYSLIDLESICCAAVQQLKSIARTDLLEMLEEIPGEWLAPGDHQNLEVLIEQLLKRTDRLETLIRPHMEALVALSQENFRPGHATARSRMNFLFACGSKREIR